MGITLKQLDKTIGMMKKGYVYYTIEPTRFKEYYILTKRFPFLKKRKFGFDYERIRHKVDPCEPSHLLCSPDTANQMRKLLKKRKKPKVVADKDVNKEQMYLMDTKKIIYKSKIGDIV